MSDEAAKLVSLESLRETRRLEAKLDALLQGGGGGGTSGGGMEPRIARLESDVEHVKLSLIELKADGKEMRSDVGSLKVGLARVEEQIKHLPSKGFIVSALLSSLAVIAGLITFSDQLHKLVH